MESKLYCLAKLYINEPFRNENTDMKVLAYKLLPYVDVTCEFIEIPCTYIPIYDGSDYVECVICGGFTRIINKLFNNNQSIFKFKLNGNILSPCSAMTAAEKDSEFSDLFYKILDQRNIMPCIEYDNHLQNKLSQSFMTTALKATSSIPNYPYIIDPFDVCELNPPAKKSTIDDILLVSSDKEVKLTNLNIML